MPLLFVYINQPACARVRKILKMTSNQSFFLDVNSVGEQLHYLRAHDLRPSAVQNLLCIHDVEVVSGFWSIFLNGIYGISISP
jgi:hypothetical protein